MITITVTVTVRSASSRRYTGSGSSYTALSSCSVAHFSIRTFIAQRVLLQWGYALLILTRILSFPIEIQH